ncbi:Serine/Threonine protein kinase [Rubellimicrobium mesophilum DSM 19309]|uniref:Serine/Threonine protein kinase n=1 Tax=Rubellimicrobium mesophilum DSM 19309 TaxID=442562 RepID=A0A017HPY4_9RHOB|nr:serine/threonine-protein kinase [Rubellimicrobium mesophilum]EYD76436.1 Serine/Threonine protein kinase [Rubellimicrobium mesophilum DSM 19309]
MIPPLPTDIFHQGQVLNNTYEIEEVIGRGGTGEVYRARNLVSGRIVAIKALSRQFSDKDNYIELMRREEQMRDITHDAVVRYTECSRSDDGNVFLVMDFMDGPSLQDELKRRRFDQRELLIVAHRVAQGLDAAHRKGIVHRDLSPDNIILRGDTAERATIIDFGIAKDTAAGARTIVGNDFAGKYEYAAPEQLEGRVDARSDLYALGASLLAAWRGEVPFAGSTPGEIVRRKREPLDTGGVPEPLKGLIDRLSAPAPAARPASAAEALTTIEKALALGKRTEPRRGGGSGPSKRGRGLDLLAALVAVVIVAGAGALWYLGLLDRLLAAPVPVASPYRLSATVVPAPALSGNAPDTDASALLSQAFAAASGSAPPDGSLSLADGVPSEAWVGGVADLIRAAGELRDWTLKAQDRDVRLAGLAPDIGTRERLAEQLPKRAGQAGLTLDLDLAAGPRLLPVGTVEEMLRAAANCGPLSLVDPPDGGYALGDTIGIVGDLISSDDVDRLRAALAEAVGDRGLSVEVTDLNEALCAVRRVLPEVPTRDMFIRLSDANTRQPRLTGVFAADELHRERGGNEVVAIDVELPTSVGDGSLWVLLVTPAGTVYNLLPTINAPTDRLEELGTVTDGLRHVPVLPIRNADGDALSFVPDPDEVGKSEVVAFLSREPLFELRPSNGESVAAITEALTSAIEEKPENIMGIATRVLETRP